MATRQDLDTAAGLVQPNAARSLMSKAIEHDDHELALAIVRRAREVLDRDPFDQSWTQVIDDARAAGIDVRAAA